MSRTLKATSVEMVPVEVLYSTCLSVPDRLLLLIASRGGTDPEGGCFLARTRMASCLGVDVEAVKTGIKRLIASGKVVRAEWERDGREHEGFRVPLARVEDTQLEALSSTTIRVCRRDELDEVRAALQEEMDGAKVLPEIFALGKSTFAGMAKGDSDKIVAELEVPEAWAALSNLWAKVPWAASLVEFARPETRRFWLSVVSNAKINPAPWAKVAKDDEIRAQLGLLMVADHLARKLSDGRLPAPRDPAAFVCGLLKTLAPGREEVAVFDASLVAADMKVFRVAGLPTVRALVPDAPASGNVVKLKQNGRN